MKDRLNLYPITTRVVGEGGKSEMTIDGLSLHSLADHYGTPLYLYDQATMDADLSAYRCSLSELYPGSSGISYAGKAFLNLAMAQWVDSQGISLDCSGAGELYIAAQAGLPRQRLILHGVNKSPSDLLAAIQTAGTLVVDNLVELDRILGIQKQGDSLPDLWLRLRPGVTVHTHSHIQTGQPDSKFGLSSEEFVQAVRVCFTHGLSLKGVHFHLGSHLHDPSPISAAIEITLDLIKQCHRQIGWLPEVICPGGGWGVPYHEEDLPHSPIKTLVSAIAETLIRCTAQLNLPLFHLQLEPGRSLIARAGVALYRIGAVKTTASRRYVYLDGGLADNPRPALYQARYSALPVAAPLRSAHIPTWLAGPYCESGDILIENLPLPELLPGELISIPVSGAYQLSMSSNYNGACRPAVLWLKDQQAHLVQRRESASELIQRDLPLGDLTS